MSTKTLDAATLRAELDGSLVLPEEPGWDEARRAWQLAVDQRPDAVVLAATTADVVATVNAARTAGLRVAAQSTGHNAAPLGSLAGTVLLLGAVGQLQFEVVAHRLEHEYGVKARIQPARYNVARWVTCDEADGGKKELQRFIDANAHRVALDAVDAPCVLLEYAGELRAMQENWPKIRFHALREHAGLVFQKQLEG